MSGPGRGIIWGLVVALAAALAVIVSKRTSESGIPGPTIQYIAVEEGVKLEVVDWGGSGRPLVLIPGLGNTVRVTFDELAAKLTRTNRVYGITRRGFGSSSRPESGYSADRLGDDVLAVMDALKLDRPVLVGHSAGGSELSSIASRYPDRVAGLVYLDAGYGYAYHCPESPPPIAIDPKAPAPVKAILAGFQHYSRIPVPALAIYAIPTDQSWRSRDPAVVAKFEAEEVARNLPQAKAFEKGVAPSRVVILPKANHWVWYSYEAEVLREMDAFLRTLK